VATYIPGIEKNGVQSATNIKSFHGQTNTEEIDMYMYIVILT
jgi:hypothetical protein